MRGRSARIERLIKNSGGKMPSGEAMFERNHFDYNRRRQRLQLLIARDVENHGDYDCLHLHVCYVAVYQ